MASSSSFFQTSGSTPSAENSIQTNVDLAQTAATNAAASETASETAQTASEAAQAASVAAKTSSEAARDAASTSAAAALVSQNAAAASETAITADATQTALDRVQTAADVAATANSAASALVSENASAASQAASANSATASAGSATTSAAEATDSANSATASAASEATATTQATNAASSASTATTQATLATTNGAAQVALATTQTALATTQANNAASSASTATTQATNSANSATASANSASSAATAQAATEGARDSALAAFDSFDDRYLGSFTSSNQPTTDNDGDALLAGSLYYDSTASAIQVYTGTGWTAAYVSGTGFAALSGATFTGNVTVPNLTVSGNVDGRNVSADGTKLDGIEASATADQTASEIKTAYEGNSDTNAFTDALQTKLNGIESSATADQTGAQIKTAYEAQSNTNAFTDALQTKLNGIEASANVTDTANVVAALTAGTNVSIAANGTISSTDTNTTYSVGDGGLTTNNFTNADHTKLNGIEANATTDQTASEIRALVESASDSNVFTDADHTKLNGIEASATADQTITAGGGLSGGGTGNVTLSHSDTSAQASSNNSGRTYIQDITLDTYGHVTGLATATETVVNTDTNTTYTADGNYGLTLSGTTFRLEDDRRRNSSTTDIYSGNTHDYTFYDASHGIRWYTAGAEDMRLTDAGDLHVDGNVTAYSTTVSDPRLKDNIEPLSNALDKVNKLSGYTFTYKHDGMTSAGVMSTEVKEVLPSAIKQSKLNLMLGEENQTEYDIVQYDQLHALLIEAVKELSSKVEALENGSTD